MISYDFFTIEKHYDIATRWWNANGKIFLPPSHLPETGLVVNIEGNPAAMCWIYKTDSAFCLIEFMVIDPEIRKEKRTEVLNALITKANEISASMGFKTSFITTEIQSLVSRLKTNGFVIADTGMTNLTCNIGG